MKDKFVVCILGLLFLSIGSGFFLSYHFRWLQVVTEKNLKEIREYEYNRGYTDYQIDTYIPAPFLPDEIPVKKPNPRVMEKFKG
jgi:hypothetical protein